MPETILDVGAGTSCFPHLLYNCGFNVTAIDNVTDYWPRGMSNRHFYIINDDIVNTRLNRKFDFITCISVLEHVQEYDKAVQNLFNLLNPAGYILLTFPYNEKKFIENVYALPEAGLRERFLTFAGCIQVRK